MGPARTGDVLAILTVGHKRASGGRLPRQLGPDTYLLDAPITPGGFVVSITEGGFVNETFEGNTIDSTGSSTADDLVLAGNQFGVQVVDNTSHRRERGVCTYGLSHRSRPISGAGATSHSWAARSSAGNTIEDTIAGGIIDVSSGAADQVECGTGLLLAAR